VTQNYPQRNVSAPVAAQPKAQRHGNSFIPPKPVDPRVSGADLFAGETLTATKTEAAVEKQPKKSPSLFERFTLQREKEVTVPAPAAPKAEPSLTVQEGGKQAEDELDIPAFLRRQAN